ncbi:MAG: SsrA-binding protein SmpB [Oscillospiraceae bacterium]|nr:SsrA-binding protein SmpB [Oscillospiraceae bacterium]
MAPKDKKGLKTIVDNRKARHEYFVLESFEAGIELYGTEVKSMRAGTVNLKDSYCRVVDGEMILYGLHISPYAHGNIFNRDPLRPKRLLLHKKEILKLYGQVKQEGLALIPLSLYFKGSRVKVQLGLCKGKKLYDKRATEAEREMKRVAERAMKDRRNVE